MVENVPLTVLSYKSKLRNNILKSLILLQNVQIVQDTN